MTTSRSPWDPSKWYRAGDVPDTLPLVSIGVLSYNRRDSLRQTLDVLTNGIQYPHYEIIVIDNGSSDGSAEMARTNYPNTIVYEVGENRGVSSRNLQTQLAKGKYLFSFDDDSFPATPATILSVVEYMEAHPGIDVLNMMCYRPLTDWMETSEWPGFRYGGNAEEGYLGNYLAEGSVCYRMSSLRSVEGYDPKFVWGFEGHDLAMQFYKKGRVVMLAPWFGSLHYYSPLSRSNWTTSYWSSRHPIWFFAKHWPSGLRFMLIPAFILRKLLACALHPTRSHGTLRGLIDGVRGISEFIGLQPKLTYRQALHLGRAYLHFFRY